MTTIRSRRAPRPGLWRLVPAMLLVWLCMGAATLEAQQVTISKTSNAPSPVPSGQAFTYTLTYSWSGGAPASITIADAIDPQLDVISTLPGSPIAAVAGNAVSFTLNPTNTPALTSPSGAGTVQINVRFREGVTCDGARTCNTASIALPGMEPVRSNTVCNTASAANKWTFQKSLIAGCAVDDDVIFRVCVINPSGGNIGGLNLTNVVLSDVVPTGAVVTSVSGNWTTFSQGGSAVTLGGGSSTLPVSPWNAWYCVYLHVRFPSSAFNAGDQVVNRATLRYQTPCDTTARVFNSEASVTLCKGVSDGNAYKGLSINISFPDDAYYYPSFSPNCCGTYRMNYTNTGTLSQSGFVMEDLLPSTLNVNTIITNAPSWASTATPVTVSVYCWSAGNCSTTPCATYTVTTAGQNSRAVSTLGLGSDPKICKVRWSYSQPIGVAESIWNYLDVCVRTTSYATGLAVEPPQDIINTVTVQATNLAQKTGTHTRAVDLLRPKILASKFLIGECGPNGNPKPGGPFVPGSIVRWRMAVSNVGNTDALNCAITDALTPGFTYNGNASWFFGTFNYMADQYNPPCSQLVAITPTSPSSTSATGTITPLSAIGASTANFNIQRLPFECNGTVKYLIIEFDVRVGDNPAVAPGQYPNCFSFSAANLPAAVNSNCPVVTINAVAQLTILKEVRRLPSGAFSSTATVPPGGQAEFRLTVKNTGNMPLKDICLLDIMPHTGDIEVISSSSAYASRGSGFDLPLSTAIAVTGYTFGYDATKNPRRTAVCNGFCGMVDPASGLGVGPLVNGTFGGTFAGSPYSFVASSQAATQIPINGTLSITARGTVPPGTALGKTACNSFAVRATPVGTNQCLATRSVTACVNVEEVLGTPGCPDLWKNRRLDSCCGYSVTLSNAVGAVTKVKYTVLGGAGLVNSVATSPCLPTSTSPASLVGTTGGTMNFSSACTQNSSLQISFRAQSTTASGDICIELIATVNKNGVNTECRDTICFRCDPAPKTKCDRMTVAPYTFGNLNQSWRTFRVLNQKNPASPIRQIRIALSPDPYGPPGGNHWTGGGLYVDVNTPQIPWTAGISGNSWNSTSPTWYSLVDLKCSPTSTAKLNVNAANNWVQFNLGVDYSLGWTGTVTVTTIHCDGDSCVNTYNWCALSAWSDCNVHVAGDLTRLESISTALYAERIIIGGDRRVDVRYAMIEPVSVDGARIFALGARESGVGETGRKSSMARISQSSILSNDRLGRYAALVEFDSALRSDDSVEVPIVIELPAGSRAETIRLRVTLYDAESNIVQIDSAVVGPISRVENGSTDGFVNGDIELYLPEPTPASGSVRLGYRLASAQTVSLDLYDAHGSRVAAIESGIREAGEHAAIFNTIALASGVYRLVLSTPAGIVTRPVIVAR